MLSASGAVTDSNCVYTSAVPLVDVSQSTAYDDLLLEDANNANSIYLVYKKLAVYCKTLYVCRRVVSLRSFGQFYGVISMFFRNIDHGKIWSICLIQ